MQNKVPNYYDPSKAGTMFRPDETTIINAALASGWASCHKDQETVALLLIDCQGDFVFPPNAPFPGSLSVPGAVEDMQRIAEFIYNQGDKITAVFASLDTHYLYQVFHRMWWKHGDGRYVEPMTLISDADVKTGKFRPVIEPKWDYTKLLEADGKKTLMVWPEHCLAISPGSSMVPIVSEAIIYHNAARKSQVNILWKGNEPKTESYGILEPEVAVENSKVATARGFNMSFVQVLQSYDKLYIAGEAKSHCVLETINQLVEHFQSNSPEALEKVFLLEDCMSPVPAVEDADGNVLVDFPAIADARFEEYKSMGLHVVQSTDEI